MDTHGIQFNIDIGGVCFNSDFAWHVDGVLQKHNYINNASGWYIDTYIFVCVNYIIHSIFTKTSKNISNTYRLDFEYSALSDLLCRCTVDFDPLFIRLPNIYGIHMTWVVRLIYVNFIHIYHAGKSNLKFYIRH